MLPVLGMNDVNAETFGEATKRMLVVARHPRDIDMKVLMVARSLRLSVNMLLLTGAAARRQCIARAQGLLVSIGMPMPGHWTPGTGRVCMVAPPVGAAARNLLAADSDWGWVEPMCRSLVALVDC